jgi:hypothetical protein
MLEKWGGWGIIAIFSCLFGTWAGQEMVLRQVVPKMEKISRESFERGVRVGVQMSTDRSKHGRMGKRN